MKTTLNNKVFAMEAMERAEKKVQDPEQTSAKAETKSTSKTETRTSAKTPSKDLSKNQETTNNQAPSATNPTCAIGFVKTRIADWKVQKVIESMEELAESIDADILDVIVDRSGSRDIDRRAIDDIYDWIELAPVNVLIAENLHDITDDKDDFEKFLDDMDNRDILVICMSGGAVFVPDSMRIACDGDCEE